MLGRDHEYVDILERAHDAYLQRAEPLRAFRCAFWCGMILLTRGEVGPWAARGSAARSACANDSRSDSVERGYLLMPLAFKHEAAGEFETAAAVAGRGYGDGGALRGCGWLRAGQPCPGRHAHQGGPSARGPRRPRRVDARGNQRRPVADDDGHRLLRRHPRLPGGVRGAPGAGVDSGTDGVVRGPARRRRVHRPLPRAPRRDPPARRRLAGRPRGGAEGEAALHRCREPRSRRLGALPGGRAPSAARRLRGGGAGLPRSQRSRLGPAARALRSSGLRRDEWTRRRLRFNACSPRPRSR